MQYRITVVLQCQFSEHVVLSILARGPSYLIGFHGLGLNKSEIVDLNKIFVCLLVLYLEAVIGSL